MTEWFNCRIVKLPDLQIYFIFCALMEALIAFEIVSQYLT